MRTLAKFMAFAALAFTITCGSGRAAAQTGDTILHPADTQKLLPASVYYKGQSAPSQLRNSGGVKFSDGYYVLATLVDNSGYSSDIASKYQAYFVAEVPLTIGDHPLPAGVYGIGFIQDHNFVVTDVGAHDVLTVKSSPDDSMKRPMPLQIMPGPNGSGFRLYAGRSYVEFSRSK